jgi:enoyl-CoA hydratase
MSNTDPQAAVPPFQHILYEVEFGRARITLNRPERRNALSLALLEELHDALWEADDDKAVHCVVLKGAGPDFSAGYDLTPSTFGKFERPRRATRYRDGSIYSDQATFDDDAWRLEMSQRLRMAIFDMHKPVVAQVHGNCLAGGTDLALLCDMVIAADDASFGVPPVRGMGTTPNHMWIYHVGPQWAKRLLLTGDTISGADAQTIGLVLKSVPREELEAEVEALLDRLSWIDPDMLSGNKRTVNLALELMGARTMQRLNAEIDARLHVSPATRHLRDVIARDGLRPALRERDAKFGDGRVTIGRRKT